MAHHYEFEARSYAEAVVAGDISTCRWVKQACQRQLNDLARFKGKSSPFRFNCHEGRPTPPGMKTVSLCCAVGASAVRLKGRSPVAEGRIIFRWLRPRFLT